LRVTFKCCRAGLPKRLGLCD